MVTVYRNEPVENLKKQGWELTGKPVSLDMHPDLVRESELIEALGKRSAYAQYSLEFGEQKKTIAYALKECKCCGKCD